MLSVLPAGKSPGTHEIHASLGQGVDTSYCIYREDRLEPASSYIIRSEATSSRTIVNYNELPEMSFSEFRRVADAFADEECWYHFEVRAL